MDKCIYFDKLYEQLSCKGLIIPQFVQYNGEYSEYCRYLEINTDIWDSVIREYGNSFNNVIFINCKKNILMNKCFFNNVNKKTARAAVYFSLLCCILDYCLDHGSSAQKEEAAIKLKYDHWSHYFIDFGKCKDNSVIDMLFYETALGMKEIKEKNNVKYGNILHLMKQTAAAELYVSDNTNNAFSEYKILSKSILFVQAASELATGCQSMLETQAKAILAMGKAFAFIDDICDHFEDRMTGQQNILEGLIEQHGIDTALSLAADEISNCLETVKIYTDPSFYSLVMKEIHDWCLNCPELRERILLYGKYNDNSKM